MAAWLWFMDKFCFHSLPGWKREALRDFFKVEDKIPFHKTGFQREISKLKKVLWTPNNIMQVDTHLWCNFFYKFIKVF